MAEEREKEQTVSPEEQTAEAPSLLDEIVTATKLKPKDEAYSLAKKGVEALMKESMNSLIPVFRAMLRFKIQNVPVDKEQVLIGFCNHFGLAKDVFIAILKDRMNDEKIKGEDAEVFFEKYLKEIEKLS